MLIDFIGAQDGGLIFFGADGEEILDFGFGSTVEECANIIAAWGLANEVHASSSMDFASEYGFAEDGDAMIMYQQAIKLSGV